MSNNNNDNLLPALLLVGAGCYGVYYLGEKLANIPQQIIDDTGEAFQDLGNAVGIPDAVKDIVTNQEFQNFIVGLFGSTSTTKIPTSFQETIGMVQDLIDLLHNYGTIGDNKRVPKPTRIQAVQLLASLAVQNKKWDQIQLTTFAVNICANQYVDPSTGRVILYGKGRDDADNQLNFEMFQLADLKTVRCNVYSGKSPWDVDNNKKLSYELACSGLGGKLSTDSTGKYEVCSLPNGNKHYFDLQTQQQLPPSTPLAPKPAICHYVSSFNEFNEYMTHMNKMWAALGNPIKQKMYEEQKKQCE